MSSFASCGDECARTNIRHIWKKVFAQGSGKGGRSQQGVTRNLDTADTDPHYPCAALLMSEDEYINHHCKKNCSENLSVHT